MGLPDQYIESLCNVFDAVPLFVSPFVWVNLGDSQDNRGDLLMVPERFAVAMQDRGWLPADRVAWAKVVVRVDGTTEGNCMPEPAPGRLNGSGHEVLYRFVRGQIIGSEELARSSKPGPTLTPSASRGEMASTIPRPRDTSRIPSCQSSPALRDAPSRTSGESPSAKRGRDTSQYTIRR